MQFNKPKQINGWKTTDGAIYAEEAMAFKHQRRIDVANRLENFDCIGKYVDDFDSLVDWVISLTEKKE